MVQRIACWELRFRCPTFGEQGHTCHVIFIYIIYVVQLHNKPCCCYMVRYLYRFDISRRKIWIICSWHQYHGMIQWLASYQRRNTKRQVKWFDCVIFLQKYRKTSHMIWGCPIHWEISYIRVRWFECVLILDKYRKASVMIWRCPLPWKLSSLYYMNTGSSDGWVARYSMISDSGWRNPLNFALVSMDNITHCLQVHMNVLLFVLIKCQTNYFSCSDTLIIYL